MMVPQTADAAPVAETFTPYYYTPHSATKRRVIDFTKEQENFFDNALSITEMVWSCNYYGIAVFEPGYFGTGSNFVSVGGGSGGGGGYKVVSSAKSGGPAATSSGGVG